MSSSRFIESNPVLRGVIVTSLFVMIVFALYLSITDFVVGPLPSTPAWNRDLPLTCCVVALVFEAILVLAVRVFGRKDTRSALGMCLGPSLVGALVVISLVSGLQLLGTL